MSVLLTASGCGQGPDASADFVLTNGRVYTVDPEQEWDPARTELIEQSDSGSGDTPKLTVDQNRHAHAAWLQSVEVDIDRVRTNRFE